MMKEHLIYAGQYFTIEWYYDEKGRSQALNYFLELTHREQIQFLALVKLIGDFGKIFNKTKFNYEGDKIYAFKPIPNRFLCFFYKGQRIIITNAFQKKQQKLPVKEKEKALESMECYIERVEKGRYYL